MLGLFKTTLEFDANERKTADNVREQIVTALTSYGLPAEKIVFVSDSGPNIKAALKNYTWIPCSAHILNTVLRHTFSESNAPEPIKDVVGMLDKCKSLVKYLKKSGGVASLENTVMQECEVRWNSKINMLESVWKQYGDVRALLERKDQLHRMEGIFQDQIATYLPINPELLNIFWQVVEVAIVVQPRTTQKNS